MSERPIVCNRFRSYHGVCSYGGCWGLAIRRDVGKNWPEQAEKSSVLENQEAKCGQRLPSVFEKRGISNAMWVGHSWSITRHTTSYQKSSASSRIFVTKVMWLLFPSLSWASHMRNNPIIFWAPFCIQDWSGASCSHLQANLSGGRGLRASTKR